MDREKLIGSASSKAAYELALATCQDWQGKVKAAQARLQLLLAGPRDEEIREARAELERVTADLDRIEAGTRSEELREADARVGELRGKLREIDAQLQELVVVAPERAVVEVIAVRPGDVVGPNQPVVRVLRAEDLWVKTFVSEVDLGKVRLNDTVAVTIDSHPGVRFEGTVVQIGSVSEFTPRNVQSIDERRYQVFAVKIRVDNPQGVFRSGLAAEVVLPLREAP